MRKLTQKIQIKHYRKTHTRYKNDTAFLCANQPVNVVVTVQPAAQSRASTCKRAPFVTPPVPQTPVASQSSLFIQIDLPNEKYLKYPIIYFEGNCPFPQNIQEKLINFFPNSRCVVSLKDIVVEIGPKLRKCDENFFFINTFQKLTIQGVKLETCHP